MIVTISCVSQLRCVTGDPMHITLVLYKSHASHPTYYHDGFFLGGAEMTSVDDLLESISFLFYCNTYSFGWLDKWLYLSFQYVFSVSRYVCSN